MRTWSFGLRLSRDYDPRSWSRGVRRYIFLPTGVVYETPEMPPSQSCEGETGARPGH